MKKNIFLTFLLVFTLLFSQQALAAPPEGKGNPGGDDGTTESINLVAIGDSIAYGTGADSDYGYVYLYRDYLATKGTVETTDDVKVDLKNHALKGMKTGDLLFQISVDQKVRRSIKNANIVTISIGGNNLLACASDNYNVIDDVCAQNGVDNFVADFNQILKIVKDLNPNAEVKSLNLYNPYKDDATLEVEKALFDEADFYIGQINSEMVNQSFNFVYTIVDAYSNYVGQLENGNYKVEEYTHFFEEKRDPHPTNLGHQVLADLHK